MAINDLCAVDVLEARNLVDRGEARDALDAARSGAEEVAYRMSGLEVQGNGRKTVGWK